MQKTRTRKLAECAMLAAVYVVISLVLAPLSFGPVQLRAAEALTLLPVFSPLAIIGVTAGCLISNCIGVGLGLTLPPDILFGTLATLLAGCMTYSLRSIRWKGLPVLASLPPVLMNAVIVGWEITYFFMPDAPPIMYAVNALWVGLGEAVACCVLGLLLVYTLEKTKLAPKLFRA